MYACMMEGKKKRLEEQNTESLDSSFPTRIDARLVHHVMSNGWLKNHLVLSYVMEKLICA